jgi:hypothetical protein
MVDINKLPSYFIVFSGGMTDLNELPSYILGFLVGL